MITVHRTTAVVTEHLPMPTGHPYQYFPGARLTLSLRPGDYVDVHATLQGTNNYTFNVMFAGYLKVDTTYNVDQNQGTLLHRAMGINITKDVHHGCIGMHGQYVAEEYGRYHFTAVAYTASTAAKPDSTLWLHYVNMTAAVHHNEDLGSRMDNLESYYPIFQFGQELELACKRAPKRPGTRGSGNPLRAWPLGLTGRSNLQARRSLPYL